MTNVMRIIDRMESIDVSPRGDFEIDTKGLMCEICPRGGSITVRLPRKNSCITVKENERFEFCGRISYRNDEGTVKLDTVFYHTL